MFAAALTVAALESACGYGHTQNPALTTPTTTVQIGPGQQRVDMSVLPEHLPQAVLRAEEAAVSVEQAYAKTTTEAAGITESTQMSQSLASGFRVAPDTYITAGHVIKGDRKDPPFVNVCGNVQVFGASSEPTAAGTLDNGEGYELFGASMDADKMYGVLKDTDSTPLADMAIIKAPDITGSLKDNTDQPVARVAQSQPKTGEAVYFINYQPTPDGMYRSASQSEASNLNRIAGSLPPKFLSKPAVYGGVVLNSRDEHGSMIIVYGGKSYTHTNDTYARQGASGGMIVNQQGEVVAISVGSAQFSNKQTAVYPSELAYQTGLVINGSSQRTKFGLEYARPVTKSRLKFFLAKLATAHSCVVDLAHRSIH